MLGKINFTGSRDNEFAVPIRHTKDIKVKMERYLGLETLTKPGKVKESSHENSLILKAMSQIHSTMHALALKSATQRNSISKAALTQNTPNKNFRGQGP